MNISEFIVFEDSLSSADQSSLEGYLAHKWALTSLLPSGHTYKSSAPSVGGWSVGRASSGNDLLFTRWCW